MAEIIENPWRGAGLQIDAPEPVADAGPVAALLAHCPAHHETPLLELPKLAERIGVASVFVKDESQRMGLGSFKALGAAYAIAREAAMTVVDDKWSEALEGRTYVTASAGNHGMSVAAGAPLFGAKAVIYLADTVPEAFKKRLEDKGAEVVRAGSNYEASMEAAEAAATDNGWTLLSDSSWPGYMDLPLQVMAGYGQLAAEIIDEMPAPPTHIFLQAGVGGLAGAMAAHFRKAWGNAPQIVVVEPEVAPALFSSIKAGKLVTSEGPVSDMGRLDCKTPSMIALKGLAKDADQFVTITEDEAREGVDVLAEHGLATTTSGGAGLAAMIAGIGQDREARMLAILSEGPEDG